MEGVFNANGDGATATATVENCPTCGADHGSNPGSVSVMSGGPVESSTSITDGGLGIEESIPLSADEVQLLANVVLMIALLYEVRRA